jgi:UDP-N-acetylmuramyl pentapeptide phosphotransferase/UDP-N-acetylglucosamine-1-phosphate transferase
MPINFPVFGSLLLAFGAGLFAWLAAAAMKPWLGRHATVYPNARSSHPIPTPQGGGVAVVLAILITSFGAFSFSAALPRELLIHAAAVAIAALGLMVVGLLDDIRGLPIGLRLAAQAIAVGTVVATLPSEVRIAPDHLSLAMERGLLFGGGLWFVNLYNFMDGIDLMSVTETVSIGLGTVFIALLGLAPAWLGAAAAVLVGAMLGFAPWNAPPARMFLGDAGSLGIGLIVGTMLIHVAASSTLSAALILPLYYGIDATLTVIRRLFREREFWKAHRQHYYQRALSNGFSVGLIIKTVAALNVALIVLAAAAAGSHQSAITLLLLVVATIAVLAVLRMFLPGKR